MNAPVYNCTDIELLLADYTDNALTSEQKAAFEGHTALCPACAEAVRDTRLVLDLVERCEVVQPPPELLTRIMHQLPAAQKSSDSRRGLMGRLKSLFEPILQPRFAMGMAMTILSFSMLGKFVGPVKPLTPADLNPMSIVAAIDDKAHRVWNSAVKYYENLRLVYEIQTRLHEWNAEEEERRQAQQDATRQQGAGGENQGNE
jgi:hypothetical protein